MFHDVLDKKETIYDYKNDNFSKGQKKKTFQKAKNDNFANGLTHDFNQNIQNFFFFFGGKMSRNIMFHDVLDKKNYFTIKK